MFNYLIVGSGLDDATFAPRAGKKFPPNSKKFRLRYLQRHWI